MWACKVCGFHPQSGPNWCARGCGRDYQEMKEIMDNDFMEIGNTGLVPKENGWFYNASTGKYISPEGKEFDEQEYEATTKDS